ncbi:hypothetical protein SAMN04487851_11468 [Prevotella sp. tc2-28]|nr:hypothetical protein SAMN04487851_11468 [Prevotella sp. tc2-28]
MQEERLCQLKSFQEQMKTLRKDDSLLTGVTFNTLAGDIRIVKKEVAVFLLDSVIKYIKDEIKYNER